LIGGASREFLNYFATKNIPRTDVVMQSEDSTCVICDDSEDYFMESFTRVEKGCGYSRVRRDERHMRIYQDSPWWVYNAATLMSEVPDKGKTN